MFIQRKNTWIALAGLLLLATAPGAAVAPGTGAPARATAPPEANAPPSSRRRVALPEEDPNFVQLMDRLAEGASLYRKEALGFTCREVVISAKYDLESGGYRKGDRKMYDYLFEERPGGTRPLDARLPEIGERGGVALNYGVSLRGLDSEPAMGSAGAFMNGHLEQGRENSTEKAMDLKFSQQSTASRLISTFDKVMDYQSGLAGLRV